MLSCTLCHHVGCLEAGSPRCSHEVKSLLVSVSRQDNSLIDGIHLQIPVEVTISNIPGGSENGPQSFIAEM